MHALEAVENLELPALGEDVHRAELAVPVEREALRLKVAENMRNVSAAAGRHPIISR